MYTSARVRQREGRGFIAELSYKDEAGRWRKKSKALNATGKREAQRELEAWRAEMEAEAERQAGTAPGLTVSEYVARFLNEATGDVTPTTASSYRTLLKTSIAPFIGSTELAALDRQAIKSWVAELSRSKSRNTAAKAFVLLRSALTEAVRDKVLAENPTDGLKKPSQDKAAPNSLDSSQRGKVAAFTDIDPADPVSLAIRLALYTGMREGEICALRWRNVDTERGMLRVSESLGKASRRDLERARDAAGSARSTFEEVYAGVYLKRPKNKGSERVITFPASVADALRARRASMKAGAMAAGIPFDGSWFVVGDIEGKPMHPHNLWRRWNGLVTVLNLIGTEGNPPTFHDLRHTYATTAIANGVDVKTVSNQMGHANAAMTLNTYASADPDAARRAAEAMERVLSADARAAARPAEVIEMKGTGTDGR